MVVSYEAPLLSTALVKGGWFLGDVASSFVLWTSAELKIGFVLYFLTFSSLNWDRLCLSRELVYSYSKETAEYNWIKFDLALSLHAKNLSFSSQEQRTGEL